MKDIVKSLQQDFIAYQGSLTTPPCSEAVSWLVARDPMKISRHDVSGFFSGYYWGWKLISIFLLFQITAFRKIFAYDELLMAPNYRPLQDRNGRFCLNF